MCDQDILSALLCPVCSNYLCPPIQVCTNGHSLCPNCFNKLQPQCPQCSGKFINRRSFILEKICEKIEMPCRYTKHGCRFRSKGGDLLKHEKKCVWKALGIRLKKLKAKNIIEYLVKLK